MNKKKLYILLVIVVTLLLIGFLYLRHGNGEGKYITAEVLRGDITEVVTATGTLNAVVTVQVGSQVTGRIKTLNADFNSEVKKGQVVAEIDPDPFQAKVDSEKARLAAANASVTTARANVEKAKVDLEDAKRNHKRTGELFTRGIISENDRDVAQARYDSALAEVKAREASYENALAQVEQAKADLKSAESDLSYTKIISPVDGIVISRNVDVGQTVSASLQAPTLFLIAENLTKMQVNASVVEADIGKVKVGQEATFTVDAYTNKKFSGEITQVRNAPITLQNVVTYDVIINVENLDLKLKPGMTANVSILTAHRDNTLKIPNAAFRFHPDSDGNKESSGITTTYRESTKNEKRNNSDTNLWTISKNGKPAAVSVKIGITDGNFTEILDGDLKEGDQIIMGLSSKEKRSSTGARPPRFGF
ncbi:MAG TPA: efflux RND transporter periplasmic adaptor subunit [Thermodesulfobacteriota bacterium]